MDLAKNRLFSTFFRFSNSFTANFQLVVKPFPFVWYDNPKVIIIIAKAIVYQQLLRSFTRRVHLYYHDRTMPIKQLMCYVINTSIEDRNALQQCKK